MNKLKYKNYKKYFSFRLDSNYICNQIWNTFLELHRDGNNIFKSEEIRKEYNLFLETNGVYIIKDYSDDIEDVVFLEFNVKSTLYFIIIQGVYKVIYKDGSVDPFTVNLNTSVPSTKN